MLRGKTINRCDKLTLVYTCLVMVMFCIRYCIRSVQIHLNYFFFVHIYLCTLCHRNPVRIFTLLNYYFFISLNDDGGGSSTVVHFVIY